MPYEILPPDPNSKPAGRYEITLPTRSAADYATEGMSGLDKILANLGAGMDTAYQGAKGLIGMGGSDADIRAKRAADSALADRTTGGGALQVAGEILPTLAIPGGVAARGLGMAGRGLASAAVDSGIVGGLVGAAQPVTSDESRTLNAVIGGVGGAVLPGLVAAAKQGVSYLTQAGAQSRAAGDIIRQLGGPDRAAEVLQQIESHAEPAVTRDIPLTPAEISQNTTLGRMERTSQAQSPERWTDLRAEQAQQRYAALQGATGAADQLEARTATREADAATNYGNARDEVPGNSPEIRATIADLQSRPAFQQAVQRAVASIKNQGGEVAREASARAPRGPAMLDESKDDIVMAIRKLGGVNPGDEAVGSLAKANPFPPDPAGAVWRQPQTNNSAGTHLRAGHSLDDMASMLHQKGYLAEASPDALMDAIADAGMGKATYSNAFDYGAAQAAEDPLASAVERLTQQLSAKSAPARPVDFAGNGVRLAHETKLQLDDMIESAVRSGNRNESRTLMGVRDQLLGLMEREDFSPSYRNARETYAAQSRPIDQSQAAADIRGVYEREGAPQLAGVPQVTGTNLGRAIDRFGSNKYGPTLDGETRAGLQALQDNLGRTEGLQKLLRMTGTSGGGSNTAMDLAGIARGTAAQLAPVLGTIARLPVVKAFVESADATTKAVLADFLQNPQTFTAAVSKKLGSGKPLTRAEDAVLRLARSASAGLPALALGQ